MDQTLFKKKVKKFEKFGLILDALEHKVYQVFNILPEVRVELGNQYKQNQYKILY